MQYKLVGSGVSLDSPYGKSIMSGVKFKNALDLIQENIQNFNIRLQTLSVSSLFSQAGLNSSDLLLKSNSYNNVPKKIAASFWRQKQQLRFVYISCA